MCVTLQIEQDFRLLFGEATANKFLEKWPTTFKAKVIKESHGLVSTTELLDLMRNAESAAEVENGEWNCFTFYFGLCRCVVYIFVMVQVVNLNAMLWHNVNQVLFTNL